MSSNGFYLQFYGLQFHSADVWQICGMCLLGYKSFIPVINSVRLSILRQKFELGLIIKEMMMNKWKTESRVAFNLSQIMSQIFKIECGPVFTGWGHKRWSRYC